MRVDRNLSPQGSSETDLINRLQTEMLVEIFSYITDGMELAQLCIVCKQWNDVISKNNILWELALRQIQNSRKHRMYTDYYRLTSGTKSAKETYFMLMKLFNQPASEYTPVLAYSTTYTETQRRLSAMYFRVGGLLGEILYMIAFLIFIILVNLKLDELLIATWMTVFLPIYVTICINMSFLISYEIVSRRVRTYQDFELYSRTLVGVFVAWRTYTGRIVTWISFCVFSAWLVLLSIFLENPSFIATSWLFCTLPWILAVLASAISFRTYYVESDRNLYDLTLSCVISIVGLLAGIFVTLMWTKMSGWHSEWSWSKVFSPLFLAESLSIIFVTLRICFKWQREPIDDLWIVRFGLLLFLPILVVFHILMVLKLDGSLDFSFGVVFIPLYVASILSLFWLICVWLFHAFESTMK